MCAYAIKAIFHISSFVFRLFKCVYYIHIIYIRHMIIMVLYCIYIYIMTIFDGSWWWRYLPGWEGTVTFHSFGPVGSIQSLTPWETQPVQMLETVQGFQVKTIHSNRQWKWKSKLAMESANMGCPSDMLDCQRFQGSVRSQLNIYRIYSKNSGSLSEHGQRTASASGLWGAPSSLVCPRSLKLTRPNQHRFCSQFACLRSASMSVPPWPPTQVAQNICLCGLNLT